jgi:hypothetical protein
MFIWQQKYFIFGFHFRLTAFQTTFKVLSNGREWANKIESCQQYAKFKARFGGFPDLGHTFSGNKTFSAVSQLGLSEIHNKQCVNSSHSARAF